jgi:hypothetical protein
MTDKTDPARNDSRPTDHEGGVPVNPGRALMPGGLGIPANGTSERLGGWSDAQIPKDKLP